MGYAHPEGSLVPLPATLKNGMESILKACGDMFVSVPVTFQHSLWR